MSGHPDLKYALDFVRRHRRRNQSNAHPSSRQLINDDQTSASVPRIARLMALTIRFERLLVDGTIQNYAELARLGRVTRSRITQIMKLLDLAPDIQEEILFLPAIKGLNERNLRSIISQIDWNEQRRLFQKIRDGHGLRPTV